MKEKRESTLGILLSIINFVFVLCILAFAYLLFGDYVTNWKAKTFVVATKNRSNIAPKEDIDKVVDGIHLSTGLAYGEGFEVIRATCTACHSAKLVTQNRATRAGWEQMIRWMQETQGLWDLGKQEPIILDYLARHYAPEEIGRRANLDVEQIEWFMLNLEEE